MCELETDLDKLASHRLSVMLSVNSESQISCVYA